MSKVDDTYENEHTCSRFCGVCPTYPEIKGEVLFCSRKRSRTPKQKAGCNCSLCDVWNKYDLEEFYYCQRGPADE